MLESGIIDYGPDFMHSMEEGGWDLSKVDNSRRWVTLKRHLYLDK